MRAKVIRNQVVAAARSGESTAACRKVTRQAQALQVETSEQINALIEKHVNGCEACQAQAAKRQVRSLTPDPDSYCGGMY